MLDYLKMSQIFAFKTGKRNYTKVTEYVQVPTVAHTRKADVI